MNTDHTLEEVGQQFDVTRERIRQIEAKAIRKLKHPSRSDKLAPIWTICNVSKTPRMSGVLSLCNLLDAHCITECRG